MVAEAVSDLSWNLVCWYTVPVALDLPLWDLNAQVCHCTVPSCHVLNASLTGRFVNRHVAMVMVLLRSDCSTALLFQFAAHECFL